MEHVETERAVSKSGSAYKNTSWDLVDKMKEDQNVLLSIKKDELPQELQNKSTEEIKSIITQKEKERTAIQKEIAELAIKRQAYIEEQLKKVLYRHFCPGQSDSFYVLSR